MSLAQQNDTGPLQIIDQRKAVIRSDRRELVGINFELHFDFGAFEVRNYSATGIAILANGGSTHFNKSETYKALHLVGGVEVGSYKLRVVRKVLLPSAEGTHIAFEVVSGAIPVQKIQTIVALRKTLDGFFKTQHEMSKIPDEFRRITLEAKLYLENLQARVEQMRADKKHCSLQELQSFEDTLIPVVADCITGLFKSAYPQLQASLQGVEEADVHRCVSFFREQLKELIYQSPFAHRSVAKPLGYAGDFEMMNIIYRNEQVGDSLFGKCLHAYWLGHSEAKAVRNRSQYLYEVLLRAIVERAGAPVKIGSIACGPCREVQMIIESADVQHVDLSNCEFHLLDQDVNALKHAHERLHEIIATHDSPIKLNFVNKATRQVITHGWEESNFDLLYSAGLFDYFSDAVAKLVAKALYARLKSGGRLIIGNFNRNTPNQFGMRLALDWSLIYRSHEDLRALYGDFGGELSIEQEPEGVNLFCVIRKP